MGEHPTLAQEKILVELLADTLRRLNQYNNSAATRADKAFKLLEIETPGVFKTPVEFSGHIEVLKWDAYVIAMSLNHVYDVLSHLNIKLPADIKELKKSFLLVYDKEDIKRIRDLLEHPVQHILGLSGGAYRDELKIHQPALGFTQNGEGTITSISSFGLKANIEEAISIAIEMYEPLIRYQRTLPPVS